MAGRYPYHMGLARAVISDGHPLGMPLNQTTIANELKRGGYATHCVGKWDFGMHKWEYTPTYRGFDSFMVIMKLRNTTLTIVSFSTPETKCVRL